ncbi:MAG: hypothetical protein JXR05_17130 [Flavobacteriaceae bacterium]
MLLKKELGLVIITFLMCTFCYSQEKKVNQKLMVKIDEKAVEKNEDIDEIKAEDILNFKKPFNIFLAAGVGYTIGTNYGVAISPIDNTVQFQEVPDLHSGISTGLVWTPWSFIYNVYNKETKEWEYQEKSNGVSIALSINVFKLSFNGDDLNSTSSIDVGFGIGYKKNDFLILLSYDFIPRRQPRQFFIDEYKGQNKTLILSGTQEPVRSIDTKDDALFFTKLYQSVGIKIAYSFGTKGK